ncbi:MAG: DUF6209 family protein [Myxococcota bacterium]
MPPVRNNPTRPTNVTPAPQASTASTNTPLTLAARSIDRAMKSIHDIARATVNLEQVDNPGRTGKPIAHARALLQDVFPGGYQALANRPPEELAARVATALQRFKGPDNNYNEVESIGVKSLVHFLEETLEHFNAVLDMPKDGKISEAEVNKLIDHVQKDDVLSSTEKNALRNFIGANADKFETAGVKQRLDAFTQMNNDAIRNMALQYEQTMERGGGDRTLNGWQATSIANRAFADGRIDASEKTTLGALLVASKLTPDARRVLETAAAMPVGNIAADPIAKKDVTAYHVNHGAWTGGSMKLVTEGGDVDTYLPAHAEAGKPLKIQNTVDGRYESYDTGEYSPSVGPIYGTRLAEAYTKVEMQYRINNGPASAFVDMKAQPDGTFTLNLPEDASGKLEYWFRYTGSSGQVYWDSRDAQNFSVDILPKRGGTVSFGANGPVTSQPLKAGEQLKLDYDLQRIIDRLPADQKHLHSAEVTVSFDGGRTYQSYPLLKREYPDDRTARLARGEPRMQLTPHIKVPEGATAVQFWVSAQAGRDVVYDPAGGNPWRGGERFSIPVQP